MFGFDWRGNGLTWKMTTQDDGRLQITPSSCSVPAKNFLWRDVAVQCCMQCHAIITPSLEDSELPFHRQVSAVIQFYSWGNMLWKCKIFAIQCLLIYPGTQRRESASHWTTHNWKKFALKVTIEIFSCKYDITFRRPFAILDDLKGTYNPLFK